MQNNIFENPIFETIKVSKISLLPFIKTKQVRYKATGAIVKKKSLNFDRNVLTALLQTLDNKNFASAKPFKAADIQGNTYLEVAYSADNQFAAVQLYEYAPFTYHPLNDIYVFEGQAAEDCVRYFLSSSLMAVAL
ncbi:MAG: hypothetical protein LBR18_02115 [Tannerella sp.]|jgi:hypothetical protein|nr:hypothetical protein [Tannerella sp.]